MISVLFAAVLLVSVVPAAPLPQASPGLEVRAIESARAGRFDEAIALTTQLLERDPDRLAYRLIRALSYYYAGQPPLALVDLDYALGRHREHGDGRTLRALVHLELGDYAAALADARQALASPELPSDNVGAAHLVAGRVLLARGQLAEARAHFEPVVGLPDPVNARTARLGLELLAALPMPSGEPPPAQDVGSGFQLLELPGRRVLFQSDNGVTPAAALSAVRLLDARLAAVAAVMGGTYTQPLLVVLYRSEWDLERQLDGLYRGPGRGRALRQGVRAGDGPWQQSVHIAMTNLELLWDLTHEAVHLTQAAAGLDDVFATAPAWLVEGQAEYVADVTLREVAPTSVSFRRVLRGRAVAEAARAGRLLDLRGLERFAEWGPAQTRDGELMYAQAYYAAALVAERYGQQAALALLRALHRGESAEGAFRAVAGTPLEAFYADALAYMRHRAAVDSDGVQSSFPFPTLLLEPQQRPHARD